MKTDGYIEPLGNTVESIEQACGRAKRFLADMQASEHSPMIKRCSAYHDVSRYPDMMLPATYNATHALKLLGAYESLSQSEVSAVTEFAGAFQQPNGAFRFREMRDNQVWKGISLEYTWNYIDMHITNYTLGMFASLQARPKHELSFVHHLYSKEALRSWLSQRDLTNPWLEGNNIVNLASFMIYELSGSEDANLAELMKIMFDWHDMKQDPSTGYWGTNHPQSPASMLEGMAGAAHNFHLYYYFNRPIPYAEKIIDHCLDFIKYGPRSACLDIDVVDILAHLSATGYRSEEVLRALQLFARQLLDFQNADGGFADQKNGEVRRMDGWVGGYWEPQGLSNCFATWFRLATLAMIACKLSPDKQEQWHFRNTIGIGYFNKDYGK